LKSPPPAKNLVPRKYQDDQASGLTHKVENKSTAFDINLAGVPAVLVAAKPAFGGIAIPSRSAIQRLQQTEILNRHEE
jgi:hypothetical protein